MSSGERETNAVPSQRCERVLKHQVSQKKEETTRRRYCRLSTRTRKSSHFATAQAASRGNADERGTGDGGEGSSPRNRQKRPRTPRQGARQALPAHGRHPSPSFLGLTLARGSSARGWALHRAAVNLRGPLQPGLESLTQSFILSFVHSFTQSFTHSFVHPVFHSFMCSPSHSLTHPLTHSLRALGSLTRAGVASAPRDGGAGAGHGETRRLWPRGLATPHYPVGTGFLGRKYARLGKQERSQHPTASGWTAVLDVRCQEADS